MILRVLALGRELLHGFIGYENAMLGVIVCVDRRPSLFSSFLPSHICGYAALHKICLFLKQKN